MSTSNYLLDAALALAARDVPVFPCDPRNKHPLPPADIDSAGRKIQGTGGHKKATTDQAQIKEWWKQWPGAAIGVPTGLPQTWDGCDLDRKHGKDGFAAVPDWEILSPVIVATPSDGRHLYFKSTSTLRSTTSQIALGVDTRGVGGYVVVPPSPGYKFIKGNFGCLGNLPPWPEKYWLPERESAAEHVSRDPLAPIAKIEVALQHIPNNDLDWERWNEIGMAIFRATGGDPDGLGLFHTWSQKSTKYHPDDCVARWEHWGSSSPPTKIGAGTLFQMADKAGTDWRDEPGARVSAADEFDVIEILDCPSTQPAEEDHLIFRTASDIPMEAIDWFWPDRFAKGKIGLLAGLPDMGKGCLCAYLAAATTANKPLPCGEGYAPQGHVIWFNAEDTVTDTVRPRLAAAGADCAKVHFIEGSHVGGKQRTPNLLTDVPLLQKRSATSVMCSFSFSIHCRRILDAERLMREAASTCAVPWNR